MSTPKESDFLQPLSDRRRFLNKQQVVTKSMMNFRIKEALEKENRKENGLNKSGKQTKHYECFKQRQS